MLAETRPHQFYYKMMSAGIFSALMVLATYAQSQSTNKVVCYYGSWSMQRVGDSKFTPEQVDPFICTHVIYAFADIEPEQGIIPGDVDNDLVQEGYTRIVKLKEKNPELKVLLGVGGLKEGSVQFTRMTGDAEKRARFINSAIELLRKYNFDGIDFDWQFPAFRGGVKEDKQNYALLIKEVREEFEKEAAEAKRPRLLLTMVAPQVPEYIEGGYDLPSLTQNVDFMNMLGYDFHCKEKKTYHHAPLYTLPNDADNKDNNLYHIVQLYLKNGLNPASLTLGIPAYGKTYALTDTKNAGLLAPVLGEGEGPKGSEEKGYMSYSEICPRVATEEGWKMTRINSTAMGPFASKDDLWVGYDDEMSVQTKANFAKSLGLGGVMFWSLDHMDAKGACGKGTFPLVKAAREALGLDKMAKAP